MPQVVIHGSSSINVENKKLLVHKIRESIPELLKIPENIGQVMFYETKAENRSAHKSRDQNFIFIEITMCPGRSQDMKKTFVDRLMALLSEYTAVDPKDINCVIHEIPPDNYFGGVSHKYIENF